MDTTRVQLLVEKVWCKYKATPSDRRLRKLFLTPEEQIPFTHILAWQYSDWSCRNSRIREIDILPLHCCMPK